MQFPETNTIMGECPVCHKPVPLRNVRDVRKQLPNYCSRTCQSQARFATRYRGSLSGPLDRPTKLEKTKFES